eukprot:3953885-Amphidinium_carterae.1
MGWSATDGRPLGQLGTADRKPQGVSQRRPTDHSNTNGEVSHKWPTIGASQARPTASHKGSAKGDRWTSHHQWGGQPNAADHRDQAGVADDKPGQPEAADIQITTTPPMEWPATGGRQSGQPEAADGPITTTTQMGRSARGGRPSGSSRRGRLQATRGQPKAADIPITTNGVVSHRRPTIGVSQV